jgi:ABC-type molybdate transport system substrate-binding protein
LWAELTDKIVYGENVAQALQLAASGHADACVIAASLAVGQPDLKAGLLLPLPADSLPHGAIVLRRTKHPEAARTFLKWLDSAAARRILQTHGYRLP